MLARTRALGLFCALAGVLAGITAGCSSSRGSATGTQDAGVQEGNHHPSSQMVKDDDEDDAGKSPNSDAGEAEEDAGNPCSATDDPDDGFTDTNCDGIDGDKKKAIFVTTTGSDAADGTWGKPVATLKHGIDLANTASKDVYVCKGDYKETITINSKGVRVFGGYDCVHNWQRNSSSQAQLDSPAGSALVITGVTQPVVFDHVDIESADVANPGESSVAVFIANSSQVTLRRGTFQARDGASASQPVPAAATPTFPIVPKQGSQAEKFYNCGVLLSARANCTDVRSLYTLATGMLGLSSYQPIVCPTGEILSGGDGGGTDTSNCYNGTSGSPGSPPSSSGTRDGLSGRDGSTPSALTVGYGTLTASGYQASNTGPAGQEGTVGESGTGGFGGGVILFGPSCDVCTNFEPRPVAGGGQGGPGGCAGLGGAPGNAGGASIAIAVYHSNVTVERALLQTGKGGGGSAGGLGAAGAAGIAGGAPGMVDACGTLVTDANYTGVAQAGGKGGNGGNGSQGGPGGGGPSFPLFVSGSVPTLSAVTFLPGSGGPGGSNGGPRAADGESSDQKVLP